MSSETTQFRFEGAEIPVYVARPDAVIPAAAGIQRRSTEVIPAVAR
jgi:hypothetical protein